MTNFLYANARTAIVTACVAALLVAWVMRGAVPDEWLAAWVAAVFLVNVARYLIFVGPQPEGKDQRSNTARFTAGIFVSGVIWGTAGVLFFSSDALYHQVFLAFALGGMVAGAVASYAAWLPAFYAFAVPVLAPISIRFFMEGNEMSGVMGGLLVIYGLALAALTHNVNRILKDSVGLQSALSKSEKRFRDIAEAATDWIWETDADHRFTYVSPDAAEVLGRPVEYFIGQTRLDLPGLVDDRQNRDKHRSDLDARRPFRDFEYGFVKGSGEVVTMSLSGIPVFDESGEFVGYRGTTTDISARKRATEEIRESEAHLWSVLDNLPAPVFLKDLKGRFVLVNKRWEEWWKISLQGAVGKTAHELLPAGNADFYAEQDRQIVETGKAREFDFEWTNFDGERLSISMLKFPVFDNDGNLIGSGGVASDVSERKQAEQTIRRNNSLLKSLTEIQSQIIAATEPGELFERLLATLLEFTESEYGFIGEVLHNADGDPYLKTHAITNIAWNEETRKFYEANAPDGMEFTNLESLFGAVMTTGQPVISNLPATDARSGGLPDGHPPLEAFLGIPFFIGNQMVGMAGAANRQAGYDKALVNQLEPLLTACSSAIQAYRTDKQRRLAEKNLRDNEIRFKDFANVTSDWFWEMDENLRFSYFSDRFTEVTGVPNEDLLGKTREETGIPGVDPDSWTKHLDDLRNHRPFRSFLHPRTQHDGRVVHLSISGLPIFDHQGGFQGYRGVGADVTERMNAEVALRESEDRFRDLIEGSIEGIIIHRDFRVLFVNQAYAEIFGFDSPGDVMALDTLLELVPPLEAARFKRYAEARSKGDYAPIAYEYEGIRKDGSTIWLDNKVRQISWRGVPAIQSTIVDITSRKRVEGALQESERQLAEAQRLGNIGHWRFDPKASTLKWSDELFRIFGLKLDGPDQAIGRAVSLMHPDDSKRYMRRRDAAIDKKLEFSEEARIVRPDGGLRHILIRGRPEIDDAGEVVAVFGTCQNITELKIAEDSLRKSEERHRRFAADAAHELRTPLAVLRLQLADIKDKEISRSLIDDVDAMTRTIEQLLTTARVDFLDIGPADKADLNDVCERVADHLAPLAMNVGRSIRMIKFDKPVVIRANSFSLEQAVRNLVENALHYSDEDSVVTIKVDDSATIYVIDKGPGIPADRRQEIFNRNVRADQRSTGVGLGLSIVRRTVEAHGGIIEVVDTPGGGATFKMMFPNPNAEAGQSTFRVSGL